MSARSTTRRGASKSAGSKTSARVRIPGWIWLVTGLAAGFFLAFLSGLTPAVLDVRDVTGNEREGQSGKAKKDNSPVFDFYTLLPEPEKSHVPTQKIPEKRGQTSIESVKKSENKSVVAVKASRYLLQAGSFRSLKDADRLRAQLILQGLDPKIEKVNVGGDEVWHRVQLGPFTTRQSLKEAQQALAGQKIEGLLLQLK